jgi:aminoglycoside phosphotransferase (APT) family kinase protein
VTPLPSVNIDVARRLVDEQFSKVEPASARLELHVVGSGWDNLIVRLGVDLALRLPVRAESASLVAHEARWLAEVAAPLRVRAPVPVFVGTPTGYYPWPWTVVPWIDGTVVADVPVEARGSLVDGLAAALLALHRPAPPDAPPNPFRGVPLAQRDSVVRTRIAQFAGSRHGLSSAWDDAVTAPPWPGPALWLHGDPHPHNLLAGSSGLVGMLDFGDLTAGDPANDLAAAWWCFGAADRARFMAVIDESHRYDPHVWTRAAGWAAALASAMAPGSPLEPVARHTAAQLGAGAG